MNIAHEGLRRLYERDGTRDLTVDLINRIKRILDDLPCAPGPDDMDRPAYRVHPLKGERRGQWRVRVSGDWRIVFRFVNGEAVGVNLIDYH